MTSEHCKLILDDVKIFCHLAVESTFLYSLHPATDIYRALSRTFLLIIYFMSIDMVSPNISFVKALLNHMQFMYDSIGSGIFVIAAFLYLKKAFNIFSC